MYIESPIFWQGNPKPPSQYPILLQELLIGLSHQESFFGVGEGKRTEVDFLKNRALCQDTFWGERPLVGGHFDLITLKGILEVSLYLEQEPETLTAREKTVKIAYLLINPLSSSMSRCRRPKECEFLSTGHLRRSACSTLH